MTPGILKRDVKVPHSYIRTKVFVMCQNLSHVRPQSINNVDYSGPPPHERPTSTGASRPMGERGKSSGDTGSAGSRVMDLGRS